MKKILTSAFVCAILLLSCKKEAEQEAEKEAEKGVDTAFAKAETAVETTNTNTDFQFSLAQWSLHEPFQKGDMDPMDFAAIAKDLGFTGLEYVTQLYPQLNGKENSKEAIMELAAALLEKSMAAGMDNVLIMVDHAGELADPDAQKRKAAIKTHKYWMDAAKLMGAHSVRANLFGESDPEKWHTYSVYSLSELGAYGKMIGINVIIENHGGWSSDGQKLGAVMKEVNLSAVGTLPDFGNFCVQREGGERWGAPCVLEYDMYKGTEEMMPYAKGVSAKSYAFDKEGNETKIDYARMLQIVADAGYKGYIGVEYEGDLDDAKDGIKLTKALLEKSIKTIR
ncbi:MAG: sugar phosphate isomerase/epimerase [Flavobacteriales bacterium]|jgi:sugar phosphate isomerase/epimerase